LLKYNLKTRELSYLPRFDRVATGGFPTGITGLAFAGRDPDVKINMSTEEKNRFPIFDFHVNQLFSLHKPATPTSTTPHSRPRHRKIT